MKKERKTDAYEDDGRTICNMDVDGMPGSVFRLTRQERKADRAALKKKLLYDDEPMTPPDIYGFYLGRIIHRLRDVYPHARQIFALSTPVRDEKYVLPWIVRRNKDIDGINRVALEVMEKNGVPVNDLASAVRGYDPDEIYADATHFNHTGSVILAKAVLDAVCPVLGITPDLSKIRPEDETRTDIRQ